MPVWYIDAEGAWMGENSTPYPCPPELLERLQANLPPGAVRLVDVPPFTGEHYHMPDGADAPQPKPLLALEIDRSQVEADHADPAVITGVPEGATVNILGPQPGSFDADGQPFHLVFAEPGAYEVRVHAKGYRTLPLRITAVEATGTRRKARRRAVPTETTVHVGAPVDVAAEHAAADADLFFDMVASRHTRMLPMLDEARAHLAGTKSARMAQLAAAQGSSPALVAQSIVAAADAYWATEAKREAVKKEFRDIAASGGRRADIVAAARKHGFALGQAHRPLNADIAVRSSPEPERA